MIQLTPHIPTLPGAKEDYILSPELSAAVRVALTLGQPLLLTGEPGTGKTRLAWKLAQDLHAQDPSFLPEPLVFNTKTSSTARDLFYYYDALGHFHAANLREKQGLQVSDYIALQALGKAIALSNPGASQPYVAEAAPRNAVVLVDEIDKAPRDFPNDLLSELEQYAFEIKEDGNRRIGLANGARIVLVLTSNSEKTLPEAFLRRVIFYHIPFPNAEQLQRIVAARLQKAAYSDEELIAHFEEIRRKVRRKAPATAELIAWLRILEQEDFLDGGLDFNKLSEKQKAVLKMSYSVLAKTKEDLQELTGRIK